MIPIILITKNPQISLNQKFQIDISTPNSDILIVQSDTSIGIDQVKQSLSFAKSRPYQLENKYIIFENAQDITLPAQNSLLKSLEESPEYLQYILCTPHIDSLLPTIISRSQVQHHNLEENEKVSQPIIELAQQLQSATVSQRIELAGTFGAKRERAIDTTTQLTFLYHQKIKSNPDQKQFNILTNLNLCFQKLNQNTNPQLCLENLFFTTTW